MQRVSAELELLVEAEDVAAEKTPEIVEFPDEPFELD
jgi:hypothetical protein